jgi:diguanylate cyclase (GGDEF)-like protein
LHRQQGVVLVSEVLHVSPPVAAIPALPFELSPHVGELANRLMKSFRPDADPADADRWALVEKVLALAANAEQRLAEQGQRIAELESLSMTDALTGIPNRRALDDFLRRLMASAKRYEEHGCLAYFDIDGFKSINDVYGHEAGDAVLRHVARLLTDNCRMSDFVAHLHGDEFVVVMVRADAPHGAKHAQRLQRLLTETPIVHAGSTIAVRTSFGVAPYGPGTDPVTLLRNADRAMYRNKRGPRSRPKLRAAS